MRLIDMLFEYSFLATSNMFPFQNLHYMLVDALWVYPTMPLFEMDNNDTWEYHWDRW